MADMKFHKLFPLRTTELRLCHSFIQSHTKHYVIGLNFWSTAAIQAAVCDGSGEYARMWF